MLRRLYLTLVGALVLSACGHHNAVPADSSSPSMFTGDQSRRPTSHRLLDCSAHIRAQGPSPSYHMVLGAVALQVWPDSGVLQVSSDHTVGAPRLFAKTGLLVRAGVPSTITVQASPHRVVQMGWRNGSVTPTRRVDVPPRPRDSKTTWLAFPGGYWVDRPTCLTVTIRAQGRAESERVAVGTPCL